MYTGGQNQVSTPILTKNRFNFEAILLQLKIKLQKQFSDKTKRSLTRNPNVKLMSSIKVSL